MLKIGCHVSISGGIEKSILRAKNLGINTMQIFSANSRSWKEKIFKVHEINNFQKNLIESEIYPIFFHTSYLINLASPDEIIYSKSINSFIEEMKRADLLLPKSYTPYLIVHPGAHRGIGEKFGLDRIIKALNNAFEQSKRLNLRTFVLLENTAGSGTSLGYNFSQLRYLLRGINCKQNLGVCIDTCHAFTAGYNLSEKEGIDRMIKELDRLIGFKKIKVFHLNDSRYPLGSNKDRHEHIGKGHIGLEGFRNLLKQPSLQNIPCILETPKESDEDDLRNIKMIKDCVTN